MTNDKPQKPCSASVAIVDARGKDQLRYCEQGPAGHEGTHMGDKTREEYLAELREYRRS